MEDKEFTKFMNRFLMKYFLKRSGRAYDCYKDGYGNVYLCRNKRRIDIAMEGPPVKNGLEDYELGIICSVDESEKTEIRLDYIL